MIVSEFLNNIKASGDYFPGSLYLKSSDDCGCVYKWLNRGVNFGTRREIFITLDSDEFELPLESRTVVDFIEVYPVY